MISNILHEDLDPSLARLYRCEDQLTWPELDFYPNRAGAVLVPLLIIRGKVNVLFLERQDFLRRHPGEIAFPGGEKETSDAGPLETATRETFEELGIRKEQIVILRSLEAEETIVSNFKVYPYLGLLQGVSDLDELVLDDEEIAGSFLVDPVTTPMKVTLKNFLYEDRPVHYPEFHLPSGKVIWGLTGKIFAQVLLQMGLELHRWL